jgi:transposase-like protein
MSPQYRLDNAYPRAIRETLGDGASHRTSRDKNNRVERGHRAIKQRYYPVRGFGAFVSAARCCIGSEEQRRRFRERRPTIVAEPATT